MFLLSKQKISVDTIHISILPFPPFFSWQSYSFFVRAVCIKATQALWALIRKTFDILHDAVVVVCDNSN